MSTILNLKKDKKFISTYIAVKFTGFLPMLLHIVAPQPALHSNSNHNNMYTVSNIYMYMIGYIRATFRSRPMEYRRYGTQLVQVVGIIHGTCGLRKPAVMNHGPPLFWTYLSNSIVWLASFQS